MKKLTLFLKILFGTFLLCQTTHLFSQKFKIGDLIGTNIRREDPIKYLDVAGFVREYHDWVIDEGDRYLPAANGTASPNYNANAFKWNPGYQGMSFEQFTPFYTNIIANLNEIQTDFKPICADMKFCLPHLSGTGGIFGQDALGQPAQKPYWDIALEFKPVRTNRSGNSSGSQDIFINANTSPTTTTDLAYVDDAATPASYLWYADWVTQFSKAFATDNTGNLSSFKSADGTASGQNKVGYIEIWNEQDKNWFDARFTNGATTLPNLVKFTPEEYAAMGGMAFDGFSEGAFINGQKPSSPDYPLGVKNTVNGKAKYVFGGLFDIGSTQWTFVEKVNEVCNGTTTFSASKARRSGYPTNPTVKFPFDVLNFHHYCDNSVTGLGTTGVAPELDNVSETTTTKTFKERLREIRNNAIALFPDGQGGTTKELWLSEFGWDTNLESDERSEQAGVTQEEVQGRWMARIYLEIAAAKWDRAMQFCIRDEVTKATGFGSANGARYKSSGLIRDKSNNYAPKLSYWYVSALRNTLGNYFFAQELQCFDQSTNSFTFNDSWQYNTPALTPRVYLFKNAQTNITNGVYPTIASANQDILAVWMPTASNSTLSNYKVYFNNFDGTVSTPVTLVKSTPGDADGVRSALTIQLDAVRNKFYVTIPQISEMPQYIILGNSSADTNFPACPSNVMTTAVSCDATALKWTIPAAGYDKLAIYFYQTAYGEAAPTFDLGNPKWRLYSDELPPTTTETTIAGLSQMTGNYYVALVPQKSGKIPTTTCVHLLKTAACFGGIPSSTVTGVNVGNTEANDLFNYSDVSFCYPQRTAFSGGWDDNNNTLDINLVANGSSNFYKLHAISLYDANGIDKIQIFGDSDFVNGGEVLLATYVTTRYLEWVSMPLIAQGNWKRLRLVRSSPQAVIQRIVLFGYLNTTGYTEPGCCGSATAVQVGSGASTPKATASAAFGANTNQVGQEIVVKGNFNFDMANLTLDNCTIFVDDAASVSLSSMTNLSTKQLNIKGTTIQGCKKLWKGIEVYPYGQIVVEPNSSGKKSVFRDAEKAINVFRSGNTYVTFLKVDQAIFEKNQNGIFINDNTSGVTPIDINCGSIVKGSIFDGTDTDLKPPYTGMASYSSKPLTGINVFAFPCFYVGDIAGDANQFMNTDVGMLAQNTSVTIRNSKFSNIKLRTSFSGIGIYGKQQSKINQTGFGKTAAVTFNNVEYPFYLSETAFKIKDNRMTNVARSGIYAGYGIVATGDYNNVENNSITTNGNGINCGLNDIKIRILNNDIFNYQDKNIFGITAYGYANTTTKAYDIRGNYIELKSDPTNTSSYGAGILLSNAFSPNIQGNTINIKNYSLNLTPPPGQNNNNGFYPYIYGILETNGKSGTYCTNTVTGVYNNQGWGIKTETTTGNKYDCNILNTIGKGLTFFGNCTTTAGATTNNIVDNDFGTHTHALYLQANGTNTAQIGKQFHTGNDWTNLGTGNWAGLYENATIADQTNNRFDVNAGDIALGHVDPANWFLQSPGTDLTCQAPCVANQINMVTPGHGTTQAEQSAQDRGLDLVIEEGLYYDVITEKNQLEDYAEAYRWMIRRNIYREIMDAYGTEVPEEYKAFMDKQAGTSVGKFQDFEFALGGLGQNQPELLSNILEIEAQIETIVKEAQPLLDNFQSLPTEKQLPLLEAGFGEPMRNMGNLWQERIQLHQILKTNTTTQAAELLAWNEGLPVENDFEQYEQQVNGFYLALRANDLSSLSDQDSAQVDFIAGLCPFEGGFAVYKARSLYSWLYGVYKPEWFECKEVVKARDIVGTGKKQKSNFGFDLIPNPAGDYFLVKLNNVNSIQNDFRLFSATGNLLVHKKLVGAFERVDTSNFPSGIYFVEVVGENGERSFHKILIHR